MCMVLLTLVQAGLQKVVIFSTSPFDCIHLVFNIAICHFYNNKVLKPEIISVL